MSASTWGDPNATKRVLLIHGITASSITWHHVAREFASRGYFVIAPDLLGHGNAGRGTEYTITALADALGPYFSAARPYEIVIGHSLGGVVASALLPVFKSTHPVHVVLVDPPLEQNAGSLTFHKTFFRDRVSDVKSPEVQQEIYHCSKEDAVFSWLSAQLCDAAAVEAILNQNIPWTFSHLLATPPENVRLTLLAADPAKGALVEEADLEAYPHVVKKTVWGASHVIPMDAPQAIIEAALQGIV